MDAIELLESQHQEIDDLLNQIGRASESERFGLVEVLADLFEVHATIEERIFYPAAKTKQNAGMIDLFAQEHLQVRRFLAELMDMEPEEGGFDQRFKRLSNAIRAHVQKEENTFFPVVDEALGDEKLGELFGRLAALAQRLESGDPSDNIPFEIDRPAQI